MESREQEEETMRTVQEKWGEQETKEKMEKGEVRRRSRHEGE